MPRKNRHSCGSLRVKIGLVKDNANPHGPVPKLCPSRSNISKHFQTKLRSCTTCIATGSSCFLNNYARCARTSRYLSEFVQDVKSGLDDLVKKNLRVSGQRINIAALAQQVCKKYNISPGELRSGGRRRDVAKARGSISWIAVRELGYSGADVARYLGVTNSCVTRFVASGQKPDVDDLIKKL